MSYATITEILSNRVKLKLHGDSLASSTPYYYMASYTPKEGDVVLVDTKLKIVIGKVVL